MSTVSAPQERGHKWLSVVFNMLLSPTFLIAAGAPLLMHMITKSAIASAVAQKDSVMLAFLNETTREGSYACQWFDVKMQFYVIIVGAAIAFAEFILLMINMIHRKNDALAGCYPYIVLGTLYFVFFTILGIGGMVGSGYIGPDLAAQYSETCAKALASPPLNLVTAMRLTLIVPIVLIFGMKSKLNHF